MTKQLFVITGDGGDGSFHAYYTFNKDWIEEREQQYNRGELDYYSIGVDGDGFHYDTLTVPDECTLESLGILFDCAEPD